MVEEPRCSMEEIFQILEKMLKYQYLGILTIFGKYFFLNYFMIPWHLYRWRTIWSIQSPGYWEPWGLHLFIQLRASYFKECLDSLLTMLLSSLTTAGHLNLTLHGGPIGPNTFCAGERLCDPSFTGVPDFLEQFCYGLNWVPLAPQSIRWSPNPQCD